jgi:hypothetical protein
MTGASDTAEADQGSSPARSSATLRAGLVALVLAAALAVAGTFGLLYEHALRGIGSDSAPDSYVFAVTWWRVESAAGSGLDPRTGPPVLVAALLLVAAAVVLGAGVRVPRWRSAGRGLAVAGTFLLCGTAWAVFLVVTALREAMTGQPGSPVVFTLGQGVWTVVGACGVAVVGTVLVLLRPLGVPLLAAGGGGPRSTDPVRPEGADAAVAVGVAGSVVTVPGDVDPGAAEFSDTEFSDADTGEVPVFTVVGGGFTRGWKVGLLALAAGAALVIGGTSGRLWSIFNVPDEGAVGSSDQDFEVVSTAWAVVLSERVSGFSTPRYGEPLLVGGLLMVVAVVFLLAASHASTGVLAAARASAAVATAFAVSATWAVFTNYAVMRRQFSGEVIAIELGGGARALLGGCALAVLGTVLVLSRPLTERRLATAAVHVLDDPEEHARRYPSLFPEEPERAGGT